MKKILRFSLLLTASVAAASALGQTPLPSNTAVVPVAPVEGIGTLIATSTGPFTGVSGLSQVVFTGSLTSQVYQQPTGSLVFAFQFTNNASSQDPIEKLTLSNYAPYTTRVAQTLTAGQMAATTASRTGSGVVAFNFPIGNNAQVNPGVTTQTLYIYTNATQFATGAASLINGGTADTRTFAPVPEPASFAAIGLGVVGMLRRRKA